MDIGFGVLCALIGCAVGSFLNVCMDRLPSGRSLINPPSHCPTCRRRIAPYELIPVFSYLWLRGHCRYCHAAIPRRIFLVELGMGLLFALLWWGYGFSPELFVLAFYSCLFITLLVIDLEHTIIPNKIVYPAMLVALGMAPFWSEMEIITDFWPDLEIAASLFGGSVAFGLMLLPAIVYRGGMGWGDVKMAALIGLVVGFPLVFAALFITIITGGLTAVILLLLRLKGRKEGIPFGPFLSLGALVTLFWGPTLYDWYLQLLL